MENMAERAEDQQKKNTVRWQKPPRAAQIAIPLLVLVIALGFALAGPAQALYHTNRAGALLAETLEDDPLAIACAHDPLPQGEQRERLEEELQRARRHRSRFGLLLLDVDFFKEINDRHGHQAGDGLLQDVARVIKTCMRPYDHAARWGGDEFLVLLASSDEVCLRDFAERLRSQIGGDGAEGRPPRSISIGVCMANPDDSEAALLQRVDEALYEAKNQGRNRVWVAGTPLVDEEAR